MNKQDNHVLLIEDNPGDADLVRLRLVEGKTGVEVACVNRLSDGLESLSHDSPALVLLDLNLPDSRGAETFRRVLNKAPGIPVVVLSGQDDEELALKAVHQGVQDYLVKGSFDSKQLARAMRYAVERQALLTSLDMSRKQQLQFKDQFLSHVSHELRTPLTSIHQFVTILLDGIAGPVSSEQREHLRTVLRSAQQLHTMINDLLDASRAESGKTQIEPRCIVIGDVIRSAVAMLQATADEKRVGLEMGLDSRLPLVCADPDRVLQVLINLVHNAIKFTPADGSVVVRACRAETDPDFAYISVTDTGRGISPEARPLIFERMYQDPAAIDDSRKGLGLGLYIARELVHLHGGRMWVESQLGHGSVFTFTLPMFSLAKLLAPAITTQGRLREAVSLISVELAPRISPAVGNWREMRARCLEVLRQCTLPDKDVLLPAMGSSGAGEIFLLVASADQTGAEVMMQRIGEQLERSPEVQSAAAVSISSKPVLLPREDLPLIKLVEETADRITGMCTEAIHRKAMFEHTALLSREWNGIETEKEQ
ncbi:MAG TPA: hybrid sensor histidine kinase/response regulator [Terriglobales bacterium]|nr:hybrid sensor histidine kinase/response regulator [Terriglobales bacterium]